MRPGKHQPSMVAAEGVPVAGAGTPVRASRRICALSVVMVVFMAAIVVAVAAIAFVITYTAALSTLRNAAEKNATSLATTASGKVIDTFEGPASQIRAFALSLRQDGFVFPSEDPTVYGVLNRTVTALLPLMLSQGSLSILFGITFDDGSIAMIGKTSASTIGIYMMNSVTVSKPGGCCGQSVAYGFDVNTMDRVPFSQNSNSDGRTSGYYTIKVFLGDGAKGFWFPAALTPNDYLPGALALPVAFLARNSSSSTKSFGLITATVGLNAMNDLLKKQTLTPNSYTVMIDYLRAVVATSYPAPFQTLSWTTNRNYAPERNCVTDAGPYNFTIACRLYASQFPYAPLQSVSDDKELMEPKKPMVLRKIEQDDETYHVVSMQIPNSLQRASPLPVYLLLFVPETDLIEDMASARMTVIAIEAAVLVVASLLAAAVVHLVLWPLKDPLTEAPRESSVALALPPAAADTPSRQPRNIRPFAHPHTVGEMDVIPIPDDEDGAVAENPPARPAPTPSAQRVHTFALKPSDGAQQHAATFKGEVSVEF